MAKWKTDSDPGPVLERLAEANAVNSDGSIAINAAHIYELSVAVVGGMLEFTTDVSSFHTERLTRQAIQTQALAHRLNPQSVLAQVSRLENELQRQRTQQYTLITTISIAHSLELRRIRVGRAYISFSDQLNMRAAAARERLLKNAIHSVFSQLPADYTYCRVSIHAKSIDEAGEAALAQLDILRGVWNLFNNRGTVFRMSLKRRSPVNGIVLGPIHTLHNKKDAPATQMWWYDPQYQGPIRCFNQNHEIPRFYNYWYKVKRNLLKSSYRDSLELGLVQYCRALDSRDWQSAFLQLWGVLETLTDTTHQSYANTIRRTAFLFPDSKYHRTVLTRLRDYRNSAAHTGTESDNLETLLYQLKMYVEVVLQFQLGNCHRFKSLSDAADVLQMPTNPSQLDDKLGKLKFARRFHGKGSET